MPVRYLALLFAAAISGLAMQYGATMNGGTLSVAAANVEASNLF
jgi:hypothetical protein